MLKIWRAFLPYFKKDHQFISVGEKWVNFMDVEKKMTMSSTVTGLCQDFTASSLNAIPHKEKLLSK